MKKLQKILTIALAGLLTLHPLANFAEKNPSQIQNFKSKAELEKYLSSFMKEREKSIETEDEKSTSDTGATPNAKGIVSEAGGSTNIQVEGVDEGDLIKNFDSHIYYAQDGKISIVKTDQGKMNLVSEIKNTDLTYQEIYVNKDRLVAISSQYNEKKDNNDTTIQIYDTSNLKTPKLYREVSVEGYLLQSRLINDNLYVVNTKYISYYMPLEYSMPSLMRDSQNPSLKEIPATSVNYYPTMNPESYTNIISLNISNQEKAQIESILGSSQDMYMSTQNLYITCNNYQNRTNETLITKYNTENGLLKFDKTASVSGYLLNQFSMDEYDGNFRIATTTRNWTSKGNEMSNNLYILDKNMNQIGKIENIAPEEKIYSVRFQGNKGYIVTFREVDPLFTLDLSNPTTPKLVGQLKVPGYSSYMHVLPNNTVLGIGKDMQDMYIKDRNGKEINIGSREGGIKLSLFDVSDPFNPKEKDTLILGGSGSYSEVLYNHKALMVNPEKGDFGFCARLNSDIRLSSFFNGAVLINTNNGKLTQKGTIPAASNNSYYSNNSRLTYIGNYLYYIEEEQISSYNYNALTAVSKIKL